MDRPWHQRWLVMVCLGFMDAPWITHAQMSLHGSSICQTIDQGSLDNSPWNIGTMRIRVGEHENGRPCFPRIGCYSSFQPTCAGDLGRGWSGYSVFLGPFKNTYMLRFSFLSARICVTTSNLHYCTCFRFAYIVCPFLEIASLFVSQLLLPTVVSVCERIYVPTHRGVEF